MKKSLKFGSPVLTIALFALAGILLFGSSIGGARAALTYVSEYYSSEIRMYDIGVTLNENDRAVSNRDYKAYSDAEWAQNQGVLLADRWYDEVKNPKKAPLEIGTVYKEVISATNSGNIDEYVRITLYTYWVDDKGKKLTNLSPELIELHPVNLDDYWLYDAKASTPERRVYYYNRILRAGDPDNSTPGETTAALTDTLTINGFAAQKKTETPVGNSIITTYDYDGVRFQIEAVVDAVQTHNAEDAIWSAWGRKVKINNGRLSLVD